MSAVDVVKEILEQGIPEIQNTMASMSTGCGGGSSGVAPVNWPERQKPGNSAVQEFSHARAALGEGRIDDAKQHIQSAVNLWDQMIANLSGCCSGGAHGKDPPNYGNYVRYRDVLKERLTTALRFL